VGCATVHPEDIEAWIGQPVVELDKQPLFVTMPVVRTEAADGTEIRNYVNGGTYSTCSESGSVFGRRLSFAAYSSFYSCMQHVAACNNIFYIKGGRIDRVVLLGTGGMQCSTSKLFRPEASGSANIR